MKRQELQGIRGVAVVLVLIFHLNPFRFRLGFIGVDMFFVLSGFLMSLILSRKKFSMSTAADFFERRIRRIVPLFYIFCLSTYIVCYFVVFIPDHKDIVTDLKWALTFTSNIQQSFAVTGYWDQISSYRFFVHAWSLGVEMQFYLVAPLILGGTNQWKKSFRCSFLCFLATASLIFQMLAPSKIAYGLMLSRVWQFLLGSLAFEIDREDELTEYKPLEATNSTQNNPTSAYSLLSDLVLLLLLTVIVWNPSSFSQIQMRLFGTTCTALLIILSSRESSYVLTDRILVYVGDISYSLYLIHWPLIVGTKYYFETRHVSLQMFFVLFISCIILSIIVHHSVETTLMSSSYPSNKIVIIFCAAFIFLTSSLYNSKSLWFSIKQDAANVEFNSAILWNVVEHERLYFDIGCEPDNVTESWTGMTFEKELRCQTSGSGNESILILGNSIAYRAFPMLKNVLAGRYSQLRLYSRSACVPVYNNCPYFTEASKIVVDRIKPDILVIMWIWFDDKLVSPLLDPKNDSAISVLQENLDYYSARSKYVIIDLPYFTRRGVPVAYNLAKTLQYNKTLEYTRISRTEAMAQQQYQRARIQHLNCSNCIINNVHEAMFEGDKIHLYNRSNLHAYYADGVHLTSEGLNLLRPKYEQVFDRVFAKLNQQR